jgi:hypothetical protein
MESSGKFSSRSAKSRDCEGSLGSTNEWKGLGAGKWVGIWEQFSIMVLKCDKKKATALCHNPVTMSRSGQLWPTISSNPSLSFRWGNGSKSHSVQDNERCKCVHMYQNHTIFNERNIHTFVLLYNLG